MGKKNKNMTFREIADRVHEAGGKVRITAQPKTDSIFVQPGEEVIITKKPKNKDYKRAYYQLREEVILLKNARGIDVERMAKADDPQAAITPYYWMQAQTKLNHRFPTMGPRLQIVLRRVADIHDELMG